MVTMTDTPEFIGKREAAELAGVSRRTIQHWINQGRLREYTRKAGGWPLVKRADVLELAKIVPVEEPTEGTSEE